MINHASAVIKRQLGRLIVADTIALIIHGGLGFFLVLLTEVWVAGIKFDRVLAVRILYDILVLIGAYFCGRLTDKIRKVLQGTSGHPIRKSIAGGIALSLYKIPIYAVSAFVFRVPWEQIRIAAGLYFLENMATGWLFVIILDKTRRYFSAKLENNNS